MNQDDFVRLLLTIEGISKALMDIKAELEIMNKEGVVVFVGSNHLEN